MNTVFFVLGIFCLAYASFLYNKKDQNFQIAGALGLVLLAISFLVKVEVAKATQQKIENFENSLYHMRSVIDKLGATIPTQAGGGSITCLEAADQTARITLETNIRSAIDTITKSKAALDKAYSELPEPEKSNTTATSTMPAYKSQYDSIMLRIAPFLDTNKTNATLALWNGLRPCIDICTQNTLPVSATYAAGGTCTCPANYYPTVVNGNIKCEEIDYSTQINSYTTKLNALTTILQSTPISTPIAFKLFCGGIGTPCPTYAFLKGETPTPSPAPTLSPAPTTPAPVYPSNIQVANLNTGGALNAVTLPHTSNQLPNNFVLTLPGSYKPKSVDINYTINSLTSLFVVTTPSISLSLCSGSDTLCTTKLITILEPISIGTTKTSTLIFPTTFTATNAIYINFDTQGTISYTMNSFKFNL